MNEVGEAMYQDAARVAFVEGSVRAELVMLAQTIGQIETRRERLRAAVVELRDRISPVLDLSAILNPTPSLVSPAFGVTASSDVAQEVRRLTTLLMEVQDAFDQEIEELRALCERVAL